MTIFDDPPGSQEHPLSVSEVVAALRECLEESFDELVVVGEVSRPTLASSGHLYLTLTEGRETLPCVMWRSSVARLRTEVEEGEEVRVRGRLTVYGPQGRYQLVITRLEPAGRTGALAAAFEALRQRLLAEGLLDASRKRPLPFRPRRVALVTSPTGAVLHDLLDTLLRRCPGLHVRILPVRVQGAAAAPEIAAALRRCGEERLADVVVVARGGGSLEDLWAFNEEEVARAVVACEVPVVSAVGHETDVTICDLVADQRAKTPTEAAYLVVPDQHEELRMVEQLRRTLQRRLRVRLERLGERIDALAHSAALASPRERLVRRRQHLESLRARLEALSPRAILQRGYSITRQADRVLRRADEVTPGTLVETILGAGVLRSQVTEVEPGVGS